MRPRTDRANRRRSGRASRLLAIPALILLGLSLGSCGGEPPELLSLECRLELRPWEQRSYESLSVFADLRDADGIEDIETIWILSDDAEYYWTLDGNDWTIRTEGGETWIGAANLALPDRGSLPRGPYRVVVADLGGRRVEREFRLEDPKTIPVLPQLEVQGKELKVTSPWPETLLIAYDGVGAVIKAVQVKPGKALASALLGVQDAGRSVALALYGYDASKKLGAYSWKTGLK